MALTATATPRVQHDVVQQLCLRECVVFRSSMNRSNLRSALAFMKVFTITTVACTVSAVQQRPDLPWCTPPHMLRATDFSVCSNPGMARAHIATKECVFEQTEHMKETDSCAEHGLPSVYMSV